MAESFTLVHQLSKFEDHDNPGAAALNRNVDEIDRLLIPEGTTLPTLYQIGKLFILTADDERTIYKNTGTQDAPEWTKIIKVSLLALPGVAPMADEDGKISTDFLKTGAAGDIDSKSVGGNEATDLLLLDGSQAMTGDLDMGGFEGKNAAAPTGPNSLARLADVEGLKRYEVRAASLVNVAIATALENGDTAGGVVLATGDRFALLGQTDPTQNGVYIVPASGAASRASFADTAAELENLLVSVKAGTNTGTKWIQTAKGFVLGVDAVTWIQDYGTAYSAGSGIDVTGTVISARTGEGLELVADEIVPKLDGPSLIVGPGGMKVNGLSVVEGGRIKRTTDQGPTSGPTDVTFTTEKDNENGTVDISGAPKYYTARTTGFHQVEASIKTKPGSDGTFRSLKLVLVETAEVLKEDDRSDYVGNYRARSCSVAVNVKLEAGQSVKAVFETDATDGGATIAEASLSGAYQGAGALATAGGAGGNEELVDGYDWVADGTSKLLDGSGVGGTLDGDVDIEYILEYYLISATNDAHKVYVEPNSDNAANYANAGTFALFSGTSGGIGGGGTDAFRLADPGPSQINSVAWGRVYIQAKSGTYRMVQGIRTEWQPSNACIWAAVSSVWLNSADPITALNIRSTVAATIKAGSRVRLWKRTPPAL